MLSKDTDSRYFEAHPVVCLVSERRGFLEYVVELILAGLETFIIILTITRAVLDRRFYRPHRQMSSLLSVLYRDALINYVYIIILLNVVFFSILPPASLPVALLCWQRVAHATLGSYTLLNIRKANETQYTNESLSTIIFRIPAARAESRSRSFVERAGNDIEEWLAPDPRLYPSVQLTIPPTTVVSEAEIVLQSSE